ncbi:PIN domain-containing protein [Streptomyces avermitilis]|uniref:PIN domain-containing protein n=1 Tax=Streptomyces avermitilis TaxID=33903 RepID=UPI00371C1D04
MIILDTNTIRGAGLRSSTAELLRAIGASGVETVAVPWVVMEELAAQKAVEYLTAWEKAAQALVTLADKSPWRVPEVGAADPEGVRVEWRRRWGRIVTVLPPSLTVLQQAVIREANALPPCESWPDGQKKQEKIGGRDAAIWLTAIEYARDHPAETVYFVSGNHKDFTDGQSGYPYPMDQDVADLEDRFVHLTTLDGLLPKFATPADVDVDQVRAVLDEADTRQEIVSDAHLRWEMSFVLGHGVFECTWSNPQGSQAGWAGGWLDLQGVEAELTNLHVASAYRIGDHVWVTADVEWVLSGYTLLAPPEDQFVMATTQYDTRVLVSLQDNGGDVTVLHGGRPHALDYDISSRPFDTIIDGVRMNTALEALREDLAARARQETQLSTGYPSWAQSFLDVTQRLGQTKHGTGWRKHPVWGKGTGKDNTP